MKDYVLYMDVPADDWEQGTPIGNGRMGAMIYGGVKQERIQLTEEYIWAGGPIDTDNENFRAVIDKARELLLHGEPSQADEYVKEALKDSFHGVRSQETACELVLEMDHAESTKDYKRLLNLNKAVAQVCYTSDGNAYSREYFASFPDRLVAMRISGEKGIGFEAHLERYDKNEKDGSRLLNVESIENTPDELILKAKTTSGNHAFTVEVRFIPVGGTIETGENRVRVRDAESCYIYLTASTGKAANLPADPDYEKLKKRHVDDFEPIMTRSDIRLGGSDTLDQISMPGRLLRMKNGADDPGVVEMYFQFGKYLMISSSRPGTLPAHLQGVWNDYIYAPWNADYHTNINLQMNYWPVEVANLAECEEPLNDYINHYLIEPGKRVARVNYKCRGAVLHHLSDIYGFAAVADGMWGLWPLGGAWLCYNIWEHYLFGEDKEYFETNGYPYIRECTRFFLDYMFEDDKGRLLSGPSTSPENSYLCGGKSAYLCLSPSMDIEIISGLFEMFIKAAELVEKDGDMIEEARKALAKMPPLQVGKHGQLMEWMEDYDEKEPGHRHISHMFGLYPGSSITRSTPELFAASAQTIKRRLSFGGGHTGWSAAWLISLHARLKDAEGTHEMIRKLLTKSTRDSLLDFHPPFQIDGNFGGAAGIAEMVLQSHEGFIELIPALPVAYENGSFKGLRARGGAVLDCAWKNGKVTDISLRAPAGRTYILKFNGKSVTALTDEQGKYVYSEK